MELTSRFKLGVNPDEWTVLHPRVQEAVETLSLLLTRMGYDVEITSMLRPAGQIAGESGVHATGRAVDLCPRVRKDGTKGQVLPSDMVTLSAAMNIIYRRNDQKLTCIYHNSGLGNHFHVQVQATRSYRDLDGYLPQSPITVG